MRDGRSECPNSSPLNGAPLLFKEKGDTEGKPSHCSPFCKGGCKGICSGICGDNRIRELIPYPSLPPNNWRTGGKRRGI